MAELSLTAAASFSVRGVVAMSTPWNIPRISLPLWVIRLLSHFYPYLPKAGASNNGWVDQAAYRQHMEYPSYPLRSGVELQYLIDEMHAALPKISVPVLLIHSRDDEKYIRDSMQQIYDHLTTPDKQMLWVAGGGHVITEEPTRQAVFEAAADFIKRVSNLS
jgi:carboxylesterase